MLTKLGQCPSTCNNVLDVDGETSCLDGLEGECMLTEDTPWFGLGCGEGAEHLRVLDYPGGACHAIFYAANPTGKSRDI